MMHGITSKQRQAVLNKIPSIASLFLLLLLLWINISNDVITLSSKDRVAFNAPSGRPNGKQYLQQQKSHSDCRKSYTIIVLHVMFRKQQKGVHQRFSTGGSRPKNGFWTFSKEKNTMLKVNNTMLVKCNPFLLIISFMTDVSKFKIFSIFLQMKPQTKPYKVKDALSKMKTHPSVLFDLHRL